MGPGWTFCKQFKAQMNSCFKMRYCRTAVFMSFLSVGNNCNLCENIRPYQ